MALQGHADPGVLHDLTAFQRDVLALLGGLNGADEYDGEVHGLLLKKELEAYYDGEINHGRLYPNLDALVSKGLVEKRQVNDRTNGYSLTTRGQRELEAHHAWLAEHVAEL